MSLRGTLSPSSSSKNASLRDTGQQPQSEVKPMLKRGRPRDVWGKKVMQEVLEMTGSMEALRAHLTVTPDFSADRCKTAWKNAVRQHCRQDT